MSNNHLGGYLNDDDDFVIDLSGVKALAEALQQNGTLATLECASPQ